MDLTERVDTSATRLGMQINASKTKSMAAPEGGGDLGCIQVGNERIEEQGLLESRVSRVTRPAGELHDLAEQITPGPV